VDVIYRIQWEIEDDDVLHLSTTMTTIRERGSLRVYVGHTREERRREGHKGIRESNSRTIKHRSYEETQTCHLDYKIVISCTYIRDIETACSDVRAY
jgi:hypothetical protein